MKTLSRCLLVVMSIWLTACQQAPVAGNNGDLYQALGERSGIADVVQDLLYRIVDDERINHQYKGVNVADFHRHLTDQLCQISGGPCAYTGRDMRELHEAMDITDTQFNALVENLVLAMEANGIATTAQNRLLGRLVPLYPDVRNL